MTSDDKNEARFYTDNIRTFATVAATGGLGRAARALGLTQPAVSQQIARLESLIGRRLFTRTPSGVSLTADGKTLFRHANSLIEISELIARSFGMNQKKVALRVGFSEMFSRTALHNMLWLLMRNNPDLQLRIVVARTAVLMDSFELGDLDVVVAVRQNSEIQAEFLRSEPLVWIGRAGMEAPPAEPIALLLPTAPSLLRDAMVAALLKAGRTWSATMEVANVAVAEAAIDAGFGVCAVLKNMPLRVAVQIDEEFGLPKLPSLDYYLYRRSGADPSLVSALSKLVTEALNVPH